MIYAEVELRPLRRKNQHAQPLFIRMSLSFAETDLMVVARRLGLRQEELREAELAALKIVSISSTPHQLAVDEKVERGGAYALLQEWLEHGGDHA